MLDHAKFLRVSCLPLIEQAAREHQAEMVVSLLSPGMKMPVLSHLPLQDHVRRFFHDQESVLPVGMEEAVNDIIALGKSWRDKKIYPNTVVHCHGGVSRSTAATYILLCASHPDREPAVHFEALLKMTNKPWPNLRMVEMADKLLGFAGAMVRPLAAYRAKYPRRIDAYHRRNRRNGLTGYPPR